MSKGPAAAADETEALGATTIASSAVITGAIRLGGGALLAEGAVIRSAQLAVELGGGSGRRPRSDDARPGGSDGVPPSAASLAALRWPQPIASRA